MSMTRLNRPVRRAVVGAMRNGLVVTLYPNHTIGIREHKRRKEFALPLASVYQMAVRAELEHVRLEKAKKKRGGRREVRRGLL